MALFLGEHFLPSFRLRMRFKLFAIRDELRNIRICNPSILDGAIFTEAERRINVSIQLLGHIDPFLIEQCRKDLEADKALTEKIDKRLAQFESKAPVQVLQLTDAAAKIAIYTAIANSGGWIIYAPPIATACAFFSKIKRTTDRSAQSAP